MKEDGVEGKEGAVEKEERKEVGTQDSFDPYKSNASQSEVRKAGQSTEFITVIQALASGLTAITLSPFVYVKSQVQITAQGKDRLNINSFQLASKIYKQYGSKEFFRGAGSLFGLSFTSSFINFIVYKSLISKAKEANNNQITVLDALKILLISKAISSFASVPFEVVATRIQTDNLLKKPELRQYKGLYHGLTSIVEKEGIRGIFRGSVPSVFFRSIGAQFTSLGSFLFLTEDIRSDPLKKWFLQSTLFFFGFALLMPLDNVRTKMQFMEIEGQKNGEFQGFRDCFMKSYRSNGYSGFYAGFWVAFFRAALYTPLLYFYVRLLSDENVNGS